VPSTAPTATAAKAVVSELKAPRISIEATFALPPILSAIMLGALLGPGALTAIVAIGFFMIPTAAKAVVSELKAPRISIEATSRPSWSVPSSPETVLGTLAGVAAAANHKLDAVLMRICDALFALPPILSGCWAARARA
jgi:ABC-type dipeptide/oligopeptide/nickel transport system permease subunit